MINEIDNQAKGRAGKLLFLIECVQSPETKDQRYYVIASSHKDAIKTFENRHKSRDILKVSPVASELMHPSVPVAARLIVEG